MSLSLESIKNRYIYIAPHSPMSLALESYLKEQGVDLKGFIDKNKQDVNIKQIEKISVLEFDSILILSPNHFDAIASEYLKYVAKEKIIKVVVENGRYIFENEFAINKREFAYLPQDIDLKRSRFVFISKSFIGSNNKALYLHCIKNNIDTVMLTDNSSQIDELKKYNLPYILLDTPEADYEIAIAKYIIFDQGNYTYLPPLHNDQKTVQLWHGVGLKKMSKMNNITYDYFISTSEWTNDTNFRDIFLAKKFLNLGYPRNDIFYRDEDELDLLFCDKDIYKIVKNTQKKVILYMPTHRESRKTMELDLELLNNHLLKTDAIFIIKLHPFALEFYSSGSSNSYSNIYFHSADGDIYPVLKYVDILVSDYSSIVYDFLLLDRNIIFYSYDIDEYMKNVTLLFDYDDYSPGKKVKNQDELMIAFGSQDSYKTDRDEIKNLFFDEIAQKEVSKNIVDYLMRNS